jgi:hypothetical protein
LNDARSGADALHCYAGRSVVEITDRVSVLMHETVRPAKDRAGALCPQAIVETKSDVRIGRVTPRAATPPGADFFGIRAPIGSNNLT